MIRAVTVYQIASGKRFDTRQKAAEAIADECRELLDARLKPLLGGFTATQLYQVVMELAPDAQGIKRLLDLLNAVMREEDDEEQHAD